jgi:8-oxo-dGTP pyrophosphatase MutT (NUDIX family)
MSEIEAARPVVTVATIVERDGKLLVVEEETSAGLCLNQPAGHLEAGESIVDAAVRETIEETGYRVRVDALVGIYRWRAPGSAATYVRFAFAARVLAHEAGRPLDEGIVRALWLTCDELARCAGRHRSPLVMRCIDDYRAGRRYPLDVIADAP